jgi:UTP--glucose-1-phosphate uridylyltransferase
MIRRVETAVIPAAGYGSRMEPLTMAIPKEMFPLGHLPVIEHTIIELISSGVKRICIVIRKDKDVIKEYLIERKKLYQKVDFYFAYQKVPLGLGDSIRKAKEFIEGNPFLMAIPDQLLLSEIPAATQLLDACKNNEGIWNSMVKIPKNEISLFKGSRPFKYRRENRNYCSIEDISTDETSLIRGFGRTVFLPEVLEYMTEEYMDDKTGEVDLLKTFQALKKRFPLYGIILKGKPCDVGTWEGYYFYQPLFLRYHRSKEILL